MSKQKRTKKVNRRKTPLHMFIKSLLKVPQTLIDALIKRVKLAAKIAQEQEYSKLAQKDLTAFLKREQQLLAKVKYATDKAESYKSELKKALEAALESDRAYQSLLIECNCTKEEYAELEEEYTRLNQKYQSLCLNATRERGKLSLKISDLELELKRVRDKQSV